MCATLLPVRSEMLFTHWSAVFASPQQHELASSADVVRDLSVTALLVGRLLGEIISGLGNSGTFTCTVPSQHADALDLGIDALLLVHVGRPVHRGLRHSRGLDPTSLVLIASPVHDDQRMHCGRCSGCCTLGLCRSLPEYATRLRYHGWVVCTLVAHTSCLTFMCHLGVCVVVVEPLTAFHRSGHGCTVGVDRDPPV